MAHCAGLSVTALLALMRAVAAIVRKSAESRPLPDLFIVAFLGLFRGYFPGYSKLFADNLNYLTWVVLKAHTHNCAGTVRLRSADPLDTPEIDFCYFTEGNDTTGEDLQSVIEGIRFARTLTELLRAEGVIEKEELPGLVETVVGQMGAAVPCDQFALTP